MGEDEIFDLFTNGTSVDLVSFLEIQDDNLDVNQINDSFVPGTLIMQAITRDLFNIVELLVEKGADPNLPDYNKYIPLEIIAAFPEKKIMKYLQIFDYSLKCYINLWMPFSPNQDNKNLFEIVIKNNYIDLAIMLIQDVAHFTGTSQELLELTVQDIKNFGIFNMLLNKLILSQDVLDVDTVRLLFYSIKQNNIPVFFVLAKELFCDDTHNIDEIINADGDTLLMVAAKNNYHDLVKFMMQFFNADINKAINKGYLTTNQLMLFFETEEKADSFKAAAPSLVI